MKHKKLLHVYYPTSHLKKGVGFYGKAGTAAHLVRAHVWGNMPANISLSVITQVGDDLRWAPGH